MPEAVVEPEMDLDQMVLLALVVAAQDVLQELQILAVAVAVVQLADQE